MTATIYDAMMAVTPELTPPKWGGWTLPPGTTLAYGARGIYSLRDLELWHPRGWTAKVIATIDVSPEHEEMIAGPLVSDNERANFARWLTQRGFPAIRNYCVESYIAPDSDYVLSHGSDDYMIVAGPRRSYGYMHITAWWCGKAPP